MFTTLTVAENLTKVKIKLMRTAPFFAYFLDYMKFIEDKKGVTQTLGVTKDGRIFYNPGFIEGLVKSDFNKLIGVVLHEVMHLALSHHLRQKGRNIMVGQYSLWNFAIDATANLIILKNGYALPENGIHPDVNNDTVDVLNTHITDLSNKSCEEVYDELRQSLQEQFDNQKNNQGDENGEGNSQSSSTPVFDPDGEFGDAPLFDDHLWGEEWDEGEELSGKSGSDSDSGINEKMKNKDWSQITSEAFAHAKNRGLSPAGMGREFDKVFSTQVPWRTLLRKEISSVLPIDYTWNTPNKKHIWSGLYMPALKREQVQVLIAIDTSGSMTSDDLSIIIGEIRSLLRTFNSVTFRLITHDIEVHDDYELSNGSVKKLDTIELHGGGGTSHEYLYNYIKDKRYREKLLISFTDGYSDIEDVSINKNTLFILAGHHVAEHSLKPYGRVTSIK